jgi:hypothetical protein
VDETVEVGDTPSSQKISLVTNDADLSVTIDADLSVTNEADLSE